MFRKDPRRAFSAQARLIGIITAMALLAGAGLAIFTWNRTSQTTSQSNFCGNLLSREDVKSVGINLSDYSLSEASSPDDYTMEQLCKISTPAGNTLTPAFSLRYRAADQMWPYGGRSYYDRLQYMYQLPMGSGINGWVGYDTAAVWLPDSCTSKTKIKNGPLQITATFDGDQKKKWGVEETRKRVSQVLMKSAIGVTRHLGCFDESFAKLKPSPEPRMENRAHPGSTCDLPGFSPFQQESSTTTFPEVLSGHDYRMWSCALRPDNDHSDAFIAFSITNNPQLIGDYEKQKSVAKPAGTSPHGQNTRADAGHISLKECSGSKTMLRMLTYSDDPDWPDNYKQAAKTLLPDDEVFERFVQAATKRLGCAPPAQEQ